LKAQPLPKGILERTIKMTTVTNPTQTQQRRHYLIGITGPAGCGKDTVAAIIKDSVRNWRFESTGERYRGESVSLAAPLKEFCIQVFGWSQDRLYGSSHLRNQSDPDGLTPRKALQTLGTEWGRALREDVWIDLLIRRWSTLRQGQAPSVTIVPDVRFPNEARRIVEAGGVVLRITGRGGEIGDAHASEQHFQSDEMVQWVYDAIDNSGGISALERQVPTLLDRILSEKI
jgi:hypothetical protein